MSHCSEIKSQLKSELQHLIDLTHASKKEVGAALCKNDKLNLGEITVGTEYEIEWKECPEETTPIGSIHTHPLVDDYLPSADDLRFAKEEPLNNDFARKLLEMWGMRNIRCTIDLENKMSCGDYSKVTAQDIQATENLYDKWGKCVTTEMQKQPLYSQIIRELPKPEAFEEIDKAFVAKTPIDVQKAIMEKCSITQELKPKLRKYEYCETQL